MWVPVAVWQLCELLYTCYLHKKAKKLFYRPKAKIKILNSWWNPTTSAGTNYQNSWRHIYQWSVCNVARTERHSGLCTNSVRTACPAQAWVVRRLTAWRLPRSRRRKTHVGLCIQRLVGILQRQRQTEDLCFHSSLYSHWFLFSRSSRLLRLLHFFGWETI